MAARGINRKLARTVSRSTVMTTATYGIEVIYEGQQWIFDQIQKVDTRISKDVAGLRATTTACDAIWSTDIPPTRPMLDRHAERHFMRLVTQNNKNSDLIPDEPDGMVNEEDIPILDSWTDQVVEDPGVLGDEVEQSVLVDLGFALWHETASIAWLKERISQHYAVAKDIETYKGEHSILPPRPMKSFLDRASNKLARVIA
jgi:hypothetical protein